jgi:1-deoxyxylulose-5-phosphate synthase
MNYKKMGTTGLEVSQIALGMMSFGSAAWRPWVLDGDAGKPVFARAVELGINFFDTADLYSAGASEELTGRWIAEHCKRDEVVIATKAFFPVSLAFKGGAALGAKPVQGPNTSGLSRKRLFAAVDASLKRLGTDYIDLYQIHRFDKATPIEETMEALHDIVKSGRVRYIGASSMYAWQFAKAQQVAKERGHTRFVSMQNHYNLAYREEEREMIPLCRDQGVALLPWSPLARGFLAGNRASGDKETGSTSRAKTDDIAQSYYYQDADFKVLEALGKVAAARGETHATCAYAWLLSKGTCPIVGASKAYQVEQAAKACEIALSAEECAALEANYAPHAIIGHS